MTFLLLLLANFHPARAGDDFQFARKLYRDGFYELAAAQLRCFLEEDPSGPDAPEALLLMAHALSKEGRWKEAAEAYGRFLARYPEDIWAGEALWGRALSLSKLGRHLEAAEAFVELYRRIPAGKRAVSALLKAAESFRRAGRPDSALSVLGELERTFPSAAGEEVRYEKALCLKASGRLREAAEELEGLSRPDALLTLGRISLSLGEVARAEGALRELEEKFPEESSTALLAFEMAQHSLEEGDEDRARRLFASALGSSLPEDLVPSALLGAARASRLTGDASDALARCDAFLNNFPGHPLESDVLAERVLCLLNLGEEEDALSTERRLRRGFPNSPSLPLVWKALGDFYRERGELLDAVRYYKSCLRKEHGEDVALALAETYRSLGWYEEALRIYQGTSWEDSAASAQWGLAECLEEMGDPRAAGEYARFHRRFPSDPRSEEAKKKESFLKARSPNLEGAIRALAEAESGSEEALAEVYLSLGRPEEAMRLLSKEMEDTTASDTVLHLFARSALLSGRRQEALSAYRRLISRYPESPYSEEASLFVLREKLSHIPEGRGLYEAMLSGYSELLRRYPSGDSTDAIIFGIANAYRGLASYDSSEVARALSWMDRLWRYYPESSYADDAMFWAGKLALRRGALSYADSTLSKLVEEHPESPFSPKAYELLGEIALRSGREDLAARYWEEALSSLPEDEELLGRLAELYISLGSPEKAVPLYRRLVRLRETPERLEALASSCLMASLKEEAVRWYGELISKYPDLGDSVRIAYGELLAELGRKEEAVEVLKKVESPGALSLLADMLYELGRYEDALAVYGRLGALGKEDFGRKILCLITLGRKEEARRHIKAFHKRFGKGGEWDDRFNVAFGREALDRGLYKTAREYLRKVKGGKYLPQARYYIALSYFKAKEMDKAIESFLSLVKMDPEASVLRKAHMRLGTLYYLTSQYALAADSYRKALSEGISGREAQEARFNLALSYERLGRYEEALSELEALERDFPESPLLKRAGIKRGIYMMKLRRYEEAIRHFEALLPKVDRGTQAELWFHIAEAYASLGKYEEAALAYLRISYLYPEQRLWAVTAEYEAAGVLGRMGRSEDARKLYEDILKTHGPQSEWGRAASERLKELKGKAHED